MNLDPLRVPESVRPLLGLAERWGISDDAYRYDAADAASYEELVELVDAIAGASEELWTWLVGPAADVDPPFREYVALTDLTQAADLARA
jgi:hypothetical protein